MMTLDGVIQGPGGPQEDISGDFAYGGWVAPFDDEAYGKMQQEHMKPADLLLGRKTFDIWENYWPAHAEYWPGINEVTKYVLSGKRNQSDWQNVVFLSNLEDVRKLKTGPGSDIKIWGSSQLVQSLLAHDLVDELWLKIHPVILGKGKRLFNTQSVPGSWVLTESVVTTKGVILANYRKGGKVATGTAGPDEGQL